MKRLRPQILKVSYEFIHPDSVEAAEARRKLDRVFDALFDAVFKAEFKTPGPKVFLPSKSTVDNSV